jgi:hypothetical protein
MYQCPRPTLTQIKGISLPASDDNAEKRVTEDGQRRQVIGGLRGVHLGRLISIRYLARQDVN